MLNYCKTIGALAAASALVAGNASAIEVDYTLHTGYTSEYLFRGANLGTDLIEVGFEASAEYAGYGLTAGAWYATFDAPTGLGSPTGRIDAEELDLYAEVSKDFGFLTAAVGYIYYYYPQSETSQTLFGRINSLAETYFALRGTYYGIDAELTYYWDVKGDNDGYIQGYLGKSVELNDCLTLWGGGTMGYAIEQSKFAHLTVKVGLDYEFVENVTFSPFAAHSWNIGNTNLFGTRNELVGGAMLAVSF